VNRGDFGCGVLQIVFEAASPEVAATAEFLIRGGLEQFLADRIAVADVSVAAVEAEISIRVDYVIIATGEAASATFERRVAS
jgi:uncharacterized protein